MNGSEDECFENIKVCSIRPIFVVCFTFVCLYQPMTKRGTAWIYCSWVVTKQIALSSNEVVIQICYFPFHYAEKLGKVKILGNFLCQRKISGLHFSIYGSQVFILYWVVTDCQRMSTLLSTS